MEELLHKCKGLLDKGSYSQALEIAEEALSQDPQSYAAHFVSPCPHDCALLGMGIVELKAQIVYRI